jgi:hypothetical protein
MTPDVPPPHIDPDSAPYWEALRAHRLVAQRCDNCSTYRFPPRPMCHRCHSRSSTWSELSGKGRILSWVVVHHVNHPAFVGRGPFTIVLVELAEQAGMVLYGNLRPDTSDIAESMAVHAVYEDHANGFCLVQWAPELVST